MNSNIAVYTPFPSCSAQTFSVTLSPESERMVQAVFKKSVVLIFCNFLIL